MTLKGGLDTRLHQAPGAALLGPGASNPLRGDLTSALVVQDAHARFQEAVLAGNVFIGANLAGTAVTTQAGLSATTPALTLYNPPGSTVNLVLWSFGGAIQASPAAAATVMLAMNLPALAGVTTGPVTVTNALITNANIGLGLTGTSTVTTLASGNQGQCYRVCTLSAAPLAVHAALAPPAPAASAA